MVGRVGLPEPDNFFCFGPTIYVTENKENNF